MICSLCGKHPATVQYIKNGKVAHLCFYCAGKLDGLGQGAWSEAVFGAAAVQKKCPHCNSTYKEIAAQRKLGCPDCYRFFEKEVAVLLEQLYGGATHKGKRPGGAPPSEQEAPLATMKRQLAQLVAREAFEEAAVLRDEIKRQEEATHGG